MKTKKIILPQEIHIIAQKLSWKGFRCFIAWGWCRDHFVGIDSRDIDLFTDALPEEVKKELTVVGEVGKKYGTCIVKEWERTFEITTFRKDIWTINNRKPAKVIFTSSLDEDSKRRDFTCNAIYYDILNEKFIDPRWGIEDIQNKILRFVGKPDERMEEDILRLLRYVRCKHKYGFTDGAKTYLKIFQEKLPLLTNISIERKKEELDKIIVLKNNVEALSELKKMGFFKHFILEIEALEKTPGGAPWHLEWDVWVHTLMTIKEMNLLPQEKEKLDLLWTMLFHDIGKAVTVSFWPNKRVHYYAHEEIWAKMFQKLAKNWNFSNASTEKITWLIQNHLKVYHTLEMSPVKRHRFMMHPYFELLLLVFEADKKWRLPVSVEWVEKTKKYYKKFQKKLVGIKFFTGDDVMKKFPELKGKDIGEKLSKWNDNLLNNLKI